MVYCPKCGKNFEDDPVRCDVCGEILGEEKNFLLVLKVFDAIGAILCIITLIIIFFKKNYNNITELFLFFILFFLLIIFLSNSVRRAIQSFIIRISFGGLSGKQCPGCENYVADDYYCLNCGYHLENVKGYWMVKGHLVEINKNYIRVFKTYRDRNLRVHRLSPDKYDLNKISNLEIGWCSQIIRTSPCIRFKYRNRPVKIFAKPEMIHILNEMFPNLNLAKISGWGQWIRHQNKTRFAIVIIVLIVLLSVGTWFLTPRPDIKTELNLTSASSNISGLQFINVTSYRSSQGTSLVDVEGYIENNGSSAQDYIWINCTGYDKAGNIVSSNEAFLRPNKDNSTSIQTFKPGSTAYFETILEDPNQEIVNYTVTTYKLLV
jgi:hypothetical protein